MTIPSRKTLEHTPAYVAGMREDLVKQKYGLSDIIKLSSNENPLGPPKSALDAAKRVLSGMGRYPDPLSGELRALIAEHDGIGEDHILLSHGLEEMIPALCRAYLNPGDESLQPAMTFIKYEIGARIMDGVAVKVPMQDLEIDLAGILAAVTDKTRIIWLCNPNNPTGTYFSEHALLNFLAAVPEHILVVHDEAYRDFTSADDFPMETVPLLKDFPNLILLRTFSKAYGLAGFRCGYMISDPEIVRQVLKVREIFSVDNIAAAAAAAALQDSSYLEHVKEAVLQGRDYLTTNIKRLAGKVSGVRFKESQANFIYMETNYESAFLFEEMLKQGVIVRPIGAYGLRITIGLHNENIRLIEALKKALAAGASLQFQNLHKQRGVTA